MKPVIVLVPGLWLGPLVWDEVDSLLQEQGYKTVVAPLVSTGQRFATDGKARPGPTVHDDVAAVQKVVSTWVEAQGGMEVMVVMHAGGGIVGSMALQGLTKSTRKSQGKKGGVSKLAYVAALLSYAGYDWPHFNFDLNGGMTCMNPRLLLFNDMPDDEAQKYVSRMQIQPGSGYQANLKPGPLSIYYAWQDDGIQSTYLTTTRDNIIDPKMQLRNAMEAGCAFTEECDAGHMVPVSNPECVARFIRITAGETHLLADS